MGRVNFPNIWIGNLGDNFKLHCHVWRINEKITEKSTLLPSLPSIHRGKAEAQAVYHYKEIFQGR
ncbi:hypothetical protein BDBG_16654 [Blastomyces gilchristii SLH14081]|uniref:Uncharacterized protein n=2 Tax=Blastomyces TaxID=229219 RepID=A0A179UJH3_BLAGS|nr:uncharacterized protein BDBG_16654 [Blastomyces gilchristii SLH14081]KMW67474.1 hypothetical protein BDDG_12140 [Blastomyces dermatitidis ATCC 18188]OAT06602.1 hypothetical protein BDBG_16654 [Blastomyces gilchristii SLH14081]